MRKNVKNLELPWSADKAVQQFGRTHRSNQVQVPDYVFLISKLAGEKRFASSVAKRIESLNALTHGDRNATKARDLSSFNLEGKHGNKAVGQVIHSIKSNQAIPNVALPNYAGNFYADGMQALEGIDLGKTVAAARVAKLTVKLFLNRILGSKCDIQNAIFEYFEAALEEEITLAKKEDRFDECINEIDLSKKQIISDEIENFVLNDDRSIQLNKLKVKAGMTWEEANDFYQKNVDKDPNNGFYYPITGYSTSTPILAIQASNGNRKYMIFHPMNGRFNPRVRFEKKKSFFSIKIKILIEN